MLLGDFWVLCAKKDKREEHLFFALGGAKWCKKRSFAFCKKSVYIL